MSLIFDLTNSTITTPALLTFNLGVDGGEPTPVADPNIINAGWLNSWVIAQNVLSNLSDKKVTTSKTAEQIESPYITFYSKLDTVTGDYIITSDVLAQITQNSDVRFRRLDQLESKSNISFVELDNLVDEFHTLSKGLDSTGLFFNIEFGIPDSRLVCETYYDIFQDGEYSIDLVDSNTLTPTILDFDLTPLDTYSICQLSDNTDSLPVFTEIPIPETVVEPPEVLISPFKRRVYKLEHTINCYRSSDNVEVHIVGANVSLDKDSIHYTFGLQFGTRIDAEMIAGQEFKLIIDGVIYKGIAENKSFSNSFGSESASLKGRSLSVMLTEPFLGRETGTNTTDKNWRQLIEAQAIKAGFSVTYDTFYSMTNLDWLIPANVFNYVDKTPLQVIKQLCAVVGAVCHAHENLKTLVIKPNLSVPLWKLDTVANDVYIPENLQLTYSESDSITTEFNAVHLQAEQQGVHVKAKKQGTAGDKLAADIIDPLFTANIPCVERGISVLSNSGTITTVQITTPVYVELPPIPIGKVIIIERSTVETKYITTGFSLTASRGDTNNVEQTITMIRAD